MQTNHGRYTNTRFPAVRRAMGRERAALDDGQLREVLTERFPGADPLEVEDFMRGLQRFARQAAPVAQRALVGAASGAATGMAAGPYGALAGALIGGTAGALTTPSPAPTAAPARRPAPAPRRAARPQPQTSPQTPPPQPSRLQPPQPAAPTPHIALAPSAGGASSPAAAQLLMLLSRPETMQALLGLLLHRGQVPVGATPVPSAAFANALAEFATRAAQEARPLRAARQGYYFDQQGEARCDLADDGARAQLLFEDLFPHTGCACSSHQRPRTSA
ncbi:hypothetical protein QWY82_08310 [Simiduia curdlanivorans]|uniref:Uncharacterized protein n=1 Tax=Simiduia curdlanivorans TaxID=1492769 RepID=A0ABV8V8H6_9GAMM|nr:hypothetical protein [Simiduia curdlanivorans]MDN3638806.1 hypothetical protein [Simiduia curdlanivorans]